MEIEQYRTIYLRRLNVSRAFPCLVIRLWPLHGDYIELHSPGYGMLRALRLANHIKTSLESVGQSRVPE